MKRDAKFEEDMDMQEAMSEGKGKHHKMMTMEDVSKCLEKDFAEEIADSKKYFSMANIAEQARCEEDARYLLEMAKDEYTHAYFIYDFMCEHDINVPEHQKREFEDLKNRMREFF